MTQRSVRRHSLAGYANAVSEFIEGDRREKITEMLTEVGADDESVYAVDRGLAALQMRFCEIVSDDPFKCPGSRPWCLNCRSRGKFVQDSRERGMSTRETRTMLECGAH